MKENIQLGTKAVRVKIIAKHIVRGFDGEVPLDASLGGAIYSGVPEDKINSLFDEKEAAMDAPFYNVADMVAAACDGREKDDGAIYDVSEDEARELSSSPEAENHGIAAPDPDAMQKSIDMIKRISEGYDPAADDSFEEREERGVNPGEFPEELDAHFRDMLMEEFKKKFVEFMNSEKNKENDKDGSAGMDEDDPDNTVYEVEGEFSHLISHDGKNRYVLKYTENESLGGVCTTMTFCPEDLNKVTIKRDGELASMMTFEKNRRRYSVYPTFFGNMQMATLLRRAECNINFADGGMLYLDYLVEIRGTDAQRTKLLIEIGNEGNAAF